MWCTLCRAPIVADPSNGSDAKLQTLRPAKDIAHLSSAHGLSYAVKTVASEYIPVNEELSMLVQGEKYGVKMSIFCQKMDDDEHSNWLLHTACLNILLDELGLSEANQKTWDNLALFEFRTNLGLYGEFLGMRDATGYYLKHTVSAARKPWMKRLDWSDGLAELWKFRSPESNKENRARITEVARLIQRIRIAAGQPTKEMRRARLNYRNAIARMELSMPLKKTTFYRACPSTTSLFGGYATRWAQAGGLEEKSIWNIIEQKLYPPLPPLFDPDALD